jgi:hypothetical protein
VAGLGSDHTVSHDFRVSTTTTENSSSRGALEVTGDSRKVSTWCASATTGAEGTAAPSDMVAVVVGVCSLVSGFRVGGVLFAAVPQGWRGQKRGRAVLASSKEVTRARRRGESSVEKGEKRSERREKREERREEVGFGGKGERKGKWNTKVVRGYNHSSVVR